MIFTLLLTLPMQWYGGQPIPITLAPKEFVPPYYEILVKFRKGIDKTRITTFLNSIPATEFKMKDYAPFVSVRLKKKDPMVYNYLNANPEVEYCEWGKWFWIDFVPATVCDILFIPNDPYYSLYQWHLTRIGMESAWDIEDGDSTVIIGIIDTGVAYEDRPIPDYERAGVDPSCSTYIKATDLIDTRFVPGWDFVYEDSFANDDHGHGTHICGTITQTTNNNFGCAGIAFNSTVMPLKAFNFLGFGSEGDCAFAIYYATTRGAKIINMSFAQPTQPGQIFRDAILYAAANGVIMVAGTGNSNAAYVYYPAAYPEVISVGATNSATPDSLAYYSNYGDDLEVVAPGGDLVNRIPDPNNLWDGIAQQSILFGQFTPSRKAKPDSLVFIIMLGTSCATPHVSGVCALMLAQGIPHFKIRPILDSTCLDLGENGWDPNYGFGRIDAYAALGGTDTIPPIITETTVLSDTTFIGPYYIYSQVNDLFGLSSVCLFYKLGSAPYDSTPGENIGGDYYRFTIPRVNPPTLVRYYIKATDGSIRKNWALDPPTAPAIPYAFSVYVGISEESAETEAFSLPIISNPMRYDKKVKIKGAGKIEIFDCVGRSLDTRYLNQELSFANFKPGVYFIVLERLGQIEWAKNVIAMHPADARNDREEFLPARQRAIIKVVLLK